MLNRIIVILLIISATIGYSVYQKQSLQSQLVSKPEAILAKLPETSFETLDGKPFDLHGFYKEEMVELLVVHYWGTWCGPCEAELPELLTFIKRFEGRPGVKFLLVAVNDEKVKIEKHLKTLALPKSSILWLMDNKNVHRDIFGTTRVPETYVFSSDKTTLRKYVGPQEWNKTMFFQTFDEFIQISAHKL
jgi:cytochrome c biogenesis protein CcmG/thiol:disulfide interchange protein DsbE